jgi:formate--tetrahydrofolate ligase
MRPIADVAADLGLGPNTIIPYGHYKAKIPLDAIKEGGKQGKLIVVTGITPTPAGEGKTTTVVGMTQGFGRLGKNVVATLREPSLGPIFGIKGGGSGGGLAPTPSRLLTTCWQYLLTTLHSEARFLASALQASHGVASQM